MQIILTILLLTSSVQAFELREIDLIPLESHYESDMIDLSKPMYRLGEVLQLKSDPQQFVIPFNYRFDGRNWNYEVRKCHFNPAK